MEEYPLQAPAGGPETAPTPAEGISGAESDAATVASPSAEQPLAADNAEPADSQTLAAESPDSGAPTVEEAESSEPSEPDAEAPVAYSHYAESPLASDAESVEPAELDAEAPAAEPEEEASGLAEPDADESDTPDAATLAANSLLAQELLGDQEQPAAEADSDAAELKAVLEAIVYVLNEPMPTRQIAEALGRDFKQVDAVLRQLAEETGRADRGLFIREVAGGYQMATKPEHHEVIATFVKNLKQPLKLSQAALETLAVIAYKQPITMPEILEIRGVQGGGVVKTLIDRKLITTAGRKNVIGKPMLYKTTRDFLTQFGLRDLAELPSLKEFEDIRRQSIADDEVSPPAQQTLDIPPADEPADETPAVPSVAEATAQPAPEAVPEAETENPNE